jgi:hypothetical protein
MPIHITCPGCRTRFNVSEKFAGKQGPCPKCKTVIKIPAKGEEVIVHAPQEFGPKNAKGVGVLKPIFRQEAQVSPLAIVGIAGGIVLVVVSAFLFRTLDEQSPWLLGLAAALLAPPLVLGGYTFLRDDELEPHRGRPLIARVLVCSAIYALLWGAYAWLPSFALSLDRLELFHLLFIVPPIVLAGGAASAFSLDLDFGTGVVHYALYLLVTIALSFIAGIDLLVSRTAALL